MQTIYLSIQVCIISFFFDNVLGFVIRIRVPTINHIIIIPIIFARNGKIMARRRGRKKCIRVSTNV